MKKSILICLLLVSCGPSKEEMMKDEQARQDAIAAIEKATKDSIATEQMEIKYLQHDGEEVKPKEVFVVIDNDVEWKTYKYRGHLYTVFKESICHAGECPNH